MDELITLLKMSIDPIEGGLRLDARQTKLLIRWLTAIDTTLKQQNEIVKNLKGLIEK